jgi:hypothetical protein
MRISYKLRVSFEAIQIEQKDNTDGERSSTQDWCKVERRVILN